MKLSTDDIKRKNPINRNNLFTSPEELNQQIFFGMEYVNKVLNQTVVLYEVDREKTKTNDVYQESNFQNLVFKTPIELNVMYRLDKSDLRTYDTKVVKGYYVKLGQLTFSVYEKELSENDCDIKRGDYIGLQVTPEHMEYFIVADDGRVNFDNKHTLLGTTPYYRTVVCTIVGDTNETVNA